MFEESYNSIWEPLIALLGDSELYCSMFSILLQYYFVLDSGLYSGEQSVGIDSNLVADMSVPFFLKLSFLYFCSTILSGSLLSMLWFEKKEFYSVLLTHLS